MAVLHSIFIVAMAFSSNIKRFSWILTGIMISGALVGLIGFGQFFGANIFNSQAFAKFIMGSYYKGQSLNIRFDSVLQHFIIQTVQVCSLQ